MCIRDSHEIALLIKNCEKNMVNANNLDLQNDKIFVDPQTKSVKCIFWPVVNNQRGNPPHLFLKQLPFELNFNPHEDNDYLETYKAFFGGINPFSVNSFEDVYKRQMLSPIICVALQRMKVLRLNLCGSILFPHLYCWIRLSRNTKQQQRSLSSIL